MARIRTGIIADAMPRQTARAATPSVSQPPDREAPEEKEGDLWFGALGPGSMAVQWDIPAELWRRLRRERTDARMALRIRRAAAPSSDGAGALRMIEQQPAAFLRLELGEGPHTVELGLLHPDGEFESLAKAGPVATPPRSESRDCSLLILDLSRPAPAAAEDGPAARKRCRIELSRRIRTRGRRRRTKAMDTPAAPPAGQALPELSVAFADTELAPLPHKSDEAPVSGGHAQPPEFGWPVGVTDLPVRAGGDECGLSSVGREAVS